MKNNCFKKIIPIILLINIFVLITAMILHHQYNNPCGYILILVSGTILLGVILFILIEFSIKSNKNGYFSSCKKRTFFALAANLLFSICSTAFMEQYTVNFNKLFVQITSPIALILIIIIIYRFTNIEEGDDLSLLKATNYFVAFLFTAIKLLVTEKGFLIEYYFILPLTLTQGLYELLEGKAKRNSGAAACPGQK